MRTITSFLALLTAVLIHAQPSPVPIYQVQHVSLPAEMDNQVCISGMKYLNGKLYLVSERCPEIFVIDPATAAVSNVIHTQINKEFEVEGLTSYKGYLFGISENVAAVYEFDPANGNTKELTISVPLPPKSKSGDGMEGIAANETNNKFYLLRERNEDMTAAQLWSFTIEPGTDDNSFALKYESMFELPLETPQWRYSDICYDKENNRLLCLKSFSKGKTRRQFIESLDIDKNGNLLKETLKNVAVDQFSEISNEYKDQHYSMNLEGITIDNKGNIWLVSDNTSGKAECARPAKEKTILLQLVKK